ncbi:glycyl radical protein [Desulfovibrio sp. OttesenSCG-928-C06]|nr:glycyl radical protein [Desulfovibrio sp. OttesenSCG-928-C06]
MRESSGLTIQELILHAEAHGGINPHRETHKRLFEILDTFNGMVPVIDIERARLFTASMKTTEGQPLVLRWAKALKHIAENITVYVDDRQLLAGRCGTDKGRYGILYPELDGDILAEAMSRLSERPAAPIHVEPEDVRIVMEEITPYWIGKTFHEELNAALPEDAHRLAYNDARGHDTRFVVSETASYRSSQQWVLDYKKVIDRGFASLKAETQARLNALDPLSPRDILKKKPFLEAIVITCDAIVHWAKRHAVLARQKAEQETDAVRKKELLTIAANCERVPEFPARTFHEAMQAQWFAQAFSRLEQRTGTIISNGRMDQYLYPLYKQDRQMGRITNEEVLELFDCLWLNMAQFTDLSLSLGGQATQEGYAHWEAVTIGGQTMDGQDATNELSYLILTSRQISPTTYPDLAVRIHSLSPERFLWEVAETIKVGQGYPKLFNDEEIIPLHLAKGAPLYDIYDYTASGCAEIRMPNRDTMTSAGCQVNLGAALEMTLRNGRMKKYNELLGLETGDPREFPDWETFWNAYVAQQTNMIKYAFVDQCIIHNLRGKHFAGPLSSCLHDLCMEHCIDIHSDEPIPGGLNFGFFDVIGFGTLVDSLSAIKKHVYEDKNISMDELIHALDVNFKGMEELRKMLANSPRFGNNDPYTDSIGKAVDRVAQDYCKRYSRETGLHIDLRTVSVTANVPHGKEVCALPNGRLEWAPLSDGSSPSHGADVKGPTMSIISNYKTKNMDYNERASRLLNIKFSPKCLEGEEGSQKLVSFIRTFCDLKLWHMQFNVVDRKTLEAAQADPEKFKGLIIRIAGYSAYFTELSKDLQNDLIARTEYGSF